LILIEIFVYLQVINSNKKRKIEKKIVTKTSKSLYNKQLAGLRESSMRRIYAESGDDEVITT